MKTKWFCWKGLRKMLHLPFEAEIAVPLLLPNSLLHRTTLFSFFNTTAKLSYYPCSGSFNNDMGDPLLCEHIELTNSCLTKEAFSQPSTCQSLMSAVADMTKGWFGLIFWCWGRTQASRSSTASRSRPSFFDVCERLHILISVSRWLTPSIVSLATKACRCIASASLYFPGLSRTALRLHDAGQRVGVVDSQHHLTGYQGPSMHCLSSFVLPLPIKTTSRLLMIVSVWAWLTPCTVSLGTKSRWCIISASSHFLWLLSTKPTPSTLLSMIIWSCSRVLCLFSLLLLLFS